MKLFTSMCEIKFDQVKSSSATIAGMAAAAEGTGSAASKSTSSSSTVVQSLSASAPADSKALSANASIASSGAADGNVGLAKVVDGHWRRILHYR